MGDLSNYLRQIKSVLGQRKPEIALVCENIVYFLAENRSYSLHLTVSSLRGAGRPQSSDQLWESICFLTGDLVHVLDINFELIDEENNHFRLEKSEVAAVRDGRSPLYHPESGERVEDVENHVFAYFTLSKPFVADLEVGGEQ